jgi:hypothetical protein
MSRFSTGDAATDHNFACLEGLADPRHISSDRVQMQSWLGSVIRVRGLLPNGAQRHFTGNFAIGSFVEIGSPPAIASKWEDLSSQLRAHLDAASADPCLDVRNPAGTINMQLRPETRGEALLVLISELERQQCGSPEFNQTLSRIERIAVRDVTADAAKLRRLSSGKRGVDPSEAPRVIYHMGICANRLHDLPMDI